MAKTGFTNRVTPLRTRSSSGGDSRGTVGKGNGVEILDGVKNWSRVRVLEGDYKGLVGWMWDAHLDMDNR